MRIAELSRESGVPIPTIKYYLREGLLPAGERTSPNQAQYGEAHVRRLRLIRALIDVGGVPITTVRGLLATIDAQGDNLHEALGTATHAVIRTPSTDDTDDHRARARETLDAVTTAMGWEVHHESVRTQVVDAITTLYDLGGEDLVQMARIHAEAVDRVARAEIELVLARSDVDAVVEGAVVGTVIGERIFAGLRHMAHEHYSRKLSGNRPG